MSKTWKDLKTFQRDRIRDPKPPEILSKEGLQKKYFIPDSEASQLLLDLEEDPSWEDSY
jgi:hypothetical protein